ncbi:MAG TPA: hypothetical protein VFR02_04230, partial [bacterium]|nr:hypothetical protein [bacterium]
LFGWTIDPPASLAYWFLGGMLFFTSGACLLGGSRSTVWVVPAVHLFFCADWLRGEGTWQALLQTAVEGSPRLAEALAAWEKAPGPGFPELFCLVSLFQLGVVAFSRRHWTH